MLKRILRYQKKRHEMAVITGTQPSHSGAMLSDSPSSAEELAKCDEADNGNIVIHVSDSQILYRRYPSYRKITSIARLSELGLPVLPGYVVNHFSPAVFRLIDAWALSERFDRLSMRFDSTRPEDNMRLMGSNPTVADLRHLAEFVAPPIVALVLAGNDRFAQGHSVITTFGIDTITIEIVGPGFDASDISRGQISPHESITVFRKGGRSAADHELDIFDYRELRPSDILYPLRCGHRITTPGNYQASVKQRYGKIFRIIEMGLGRSVNVKEELSPMEMGVVDAFLCERGTAIPDRYIPLSYERLSEVYSYVAALDLFSGHEVTGKSLSASFLQRHGLVFWDFYGSDKYRLT